MNLLVIRMSAMGDVAMTVPVIKALLKNHKDLHITIVSRKRFKLFLFGGGKAEIDKLKILHDKYPLTIMAAGKLSLKENWI